MYLGIDFLITPDLNPYVVEVNVGLPGGAQEYHLTHLVSLKKTSGIFEKTEETSQRVYGKSFQDYLHSLPFIACLKPLKIWMDGMGPFPNSFHPGLRLEDKWVQYQLLSPIVPMPETMIFDPMNLPAAKSFLERRGAIVLKRRVGRGGRELQRITDPEVLSCADVGAKRYLLQECVDSRVDGYTFSIRSVAFAGEWMCMYANLSTRSASNHGTLAFVSPGETFGLSEKNFETETFNQKSWEAEIWFGENDPPYLRHNLYEDVVARAALFLPEPLHRKMMDLSIKIERFYESLDLVNLPKACFEKGEEGN